MKYAIIIPDGCADEPQASLGGKTPLQAAHTPNMDRIAQTGVVGRSDNVPPPLTPASDVATLSLFGYDPLVVYTGRAPLETAAMGIEARARATGRSAATWSHVENEEMRDFTAGHISSRGRPGADRGAAEQAGRAGTGRRRGRTARVSCRRQLSQHPDLSRRRRAPFTAETQDAAAARHSRQADRRAICRRAPAPTCCAS